MGEIKSVKVDNWGVFFLQKLQNFFNKTDYCDLTLQFNDNSQLKVHRLVLSACTDYFNALERTTNCQDQILVMPRDFQADVVVPIVNFMYTGTLEFEYKMYDRLFRTAKHMNMTVLVKLLEAHRKSAPRTPQLPIQHKPPPVLLNRGVNNRQVVRVPPPTQGPRPPTQRVYSTSGISSTSTGRVLTRGGRQPQMSRPLPVTHIKTEPITEMVPVSNVSQLYQSKPLPETISIVSKYRSDSKAISAGPSRFEPTEETPPIPDELDTFNTISYESQPLMKALKEDEYDEYEELEMPSTGTSSAGQNTFEQLRKGYTNINKRPASQLSITSPPAKKPNLQDVKEYTEAARLRKQLEEQELEDDPNYVYDDDTHFNDDDDDDLQGAAKGAQKTISDADIQADENQIIVKDSSGSVDHAKIISEVLKKYPHLVKNNKNIKLKIMQKSNQEEPGTPVNTTAAKSRATHSPGSGNTFVKREKLTPVKQSPPVASKIKTEKPDVVQFKSSPVQQHQQQQQSQIKHQQLQKQQQQQQIPQSVAKPKKIDSKTMHALIAKGAENMTGPWLCLRCGIGGRPISIPSYKSFRRHLINIHKEKIDPRICEHCGWKAIKKQELIEHYQTEHNIKIKVETTVKSQIPMPTAQLKSLQPKHHTATAPQPVTASTSKKDIQHCIYCNKVFSKESLLYTHMKTAHKEKARLDGVIDFSDDENEFDDSSDKYIPNNPSCGKKINILSNITITEGQKGHSFIPGSQQIVNLEPSSEAEALSNVASGIATSLALVDNSVVLDETHFHTNQFIQDMQHHEFIEKKDDLMGDGGMVTKLVTADGAELELTQSQKDEIISQLQSQGAGDLGDTNVVMVLNEEHFDGSQIINSDSQNIVVVYSQADENVLKAATEALIESTAKESVGTSTKVVDAIVTDTTPTMDWQDVEAELKNNQMELDKSLEQAKHEEAEIEAKNDLSKAEVSERSDNDKMKLISALEGDWSEDEEESVPPKKSEPTEEFRPKSPSSEDNILFVVSTSAGELETDQEQQENVENNPNDEHHETQEYNEEADAHQDNDDIDEKQEDTSMPDHHEETEHDQNNSANEKESDLNNILGDWLGGTDDDENRSQSKDEDADIDQAPLSHKTDEPETMQTDASEHSLPTELSESLEDEHKEKHDNDEEVLREETSVPEENTELKTLINDWDDEDDGDI